MKGGIQAAVAIGVGYVLGRRRKLRLATVLAIGTATGGIAGLGGAALRRGTQALGSSEALGNLSPQLGDIADVVRGDLVEAGKAAAMAAVTGRIESLTDSLHDRAESMRDPGAAAAGAGQAVRGAAGLGRDDDRDDDEADYDEADYEPEDDEAEDDEPEDDQPEEDEDWADEDEGQAAERQPAPRRRSGGSRQPRSPRERAPVTRARR
ncbi:MAG TPA: hypothetical protein VHU92_16825 [Streptosporangiaceae bacterium]|nr:hypothetical protein [Streptosporangiaceae bacterium]